MKSLNQFAVCCLTVSLGVAFGQLPSVQTTEVSAATSTSVAHVYVKSGTRILAYSANSAGQLTKVSGSPFSFNITLSGANGHYLYGYLGNTQTIQSLSMSSTGALKKAATTDPTRFNEYSDCGYWDATRMKIDHAGLELYNEEYPTQFCHTFFQSFRIDDSNGSLIFQNNVDYDLAIPSDMSMLGNNKFAYVASCTANFGNSPFPLVKAFERMSNGELGATNVGAALPSPPDDVFNPNGSTTGYFCPSMMASDPTNHVAITLYALDSGSDGGNPNYGPIYIAPFTADAKGTLTTTSTYKNMVTLPVDNNYLGSCLACNTLRMDPSGKILAAGGSVGVLLFHFNGASPITRYKILLAKHNIGKILWDRANHMYVLGSDTSGVTKLWIYTVTPTTTTLAPGSPYWLSGASDIYIQPL